MIKMGGNMPITFTKSGLHWFDWFVFGIMALLFIFSMITTGVVRCIMILSEIFILDYFVSNYVIVDE